MSGIEFTWDSRDLQVFRNGKVDKAVARAMRLAGNQALKTLAKGTTDLVRRKKNLPETAIKEDQSQFKPSRSAQLGEFAWKLFVPGKPVPLTKFPHMRSRRGMRVWFGGTGSQRITGAFTAKMKSGHLGIYKRTRKTRLPIEEVFSSRLPKNLGGEVLLTLADPTYRKLAASFTKGLDRELAKLKRKGDT